MRIAYIILGLCLGNLLVAQNHLKVSLILPFCSKQIAQNPKHPNAELGKVTREYYQGLLLALDSLDKLDMKVKLSVFDTQNDSLVTLKQIQKPAFKESELIIGPVLQGGNKLLSPFAKENKVYHVSPLMTFSKTKLVDDYWVSSNPDLPSFAPLVFNYLKDYEDSLNIVVISDQSTFDKSFTPAFKKIIPDNKNIKIKVVVYTPTNDINTYLIPNITNVLIMPTSKEQLANSILYSVKDSTYFPRLMTIGFQQWLEFKNADIALWQTKNVHFATTSYINYSDSLTTQFVKLYREKYFTEPSEAAIKGYDQGLFYITNRYLLGRDFMKQLEGKPTKLIHTTFQFRKSKEGGAYQNNYLNFITFDNDVLKETAK